VRPDALIDRLASAATESDARTLLGSVTDSGLSDAFLSRVLSLYATDHAALQKLGRFAELVANFGDDKAKGLRALGIVELVKGRWVESANAFIAAGKASADKRDQLSIQTGAVLPLAYSGDLKGATALANRISRGLVRLGEPVLAARARLNLANALVTQDRYTEARKVLKGLADVFEGDKFTQERIAARLAFATSHLFGGDPKVAREEADRVVADAQAAGLDYGVQMAQFTIAFEAILRGRPDEALQVLLPLREAFAETPVELAKVLEYLGDTHSRLNLWPESIDAYRQALALGDAVTPIYRAHLHFGLAQALQASAQPEEADKEFKEALRGFKQHENRAWESATLAALSEAISDSSERRAAKLAEDAVAAAREVRAPIHLARALIALARATGDTVALAEAARIVRRYGFGGLQWRIHELNARLEPAKALGHYRRMFDAMLSERALTTSTTSRTSYLRDKSVALREYLELLLSKPSAKRIDEALSVVERSRAAALVDEVLAGRSDAISEQAKVRLADIRKSIEAESGSDYGPAGTRALLERPVDWGGYQRTWLEETHRVVRTTLAPPERKKSGTATFVTTNRSVHALVNGRTYRLMADPQTLERQLKWVQFETLAPMADPHADPSCALRALRELASTVLLPFSGEEGVEGVSPDGVLWRVPWSACCDALGVRQLEIRLHPGFGGESAPLPADPVAALWVAEHPDLPNASQEADAFLERFPKAAVARTAAEARDMLAGRFDVLHVIAHAKHRWTNPMFSSIQFRDGAVFATEIAQSNLSVGLVSLSACETGALSVTTQDEPDGLARAFLGRGSRYVLGSAWPLDDEIARILASSFYRHLVSGSGVLHSFQLAREEARAMKPHPYYWASQVLYGGYQSL